MRNILAAIAAGTVLVSAGSAAAQRRPANAGYEAQEDAIYNAVFRHLLGAAAAPPGNQSSPPAFCVVPTARAGSGRYRAGLLQHTRERTQYPLAVRYNRLAARHLGRAAQAPDGPRELNPETLGQGLRIERVPLSGCDGLAIMTFVRPVRYGTAAFLSADWGHICAGANTQKFAVTRVRGGLAVEGHRVDNWVPGYICDPTPRSRRPEAPADAQFLLIRE